MVIYTTSGDVLLMERQHPEKYWQSVTGSLEWGEDAGPAAIREVEEETGLNVADTVIDCGYSNCFEIIPAWRDRYAPEVMTNTEHVFRVEYTHRPEIRITLEEHRRYDWLSSVNALERASSRTNRQAIQRFVLSS